MVRHLKRAKPGLALALVLLVVGCEAPAPITTAPKPHSPQALEVFAAGYEGIAEKYIEPVDMETIALEGIKGFAAIDPALMASKDGNAIRLDLRGKEIARLPVPENNSAYGWALLTVELATQARKRSREIHEASAEKLYEAVFDGALSQLDVFSRYAGAEEARRNRAQREGFGGIGIRFSVKSGAVTITEVMAGTPAAGAGLRGGDRIIRIDGEPIGTTAREVGEKLRGPPDSEVRITVFRATEERSLEVVMEREHIVPSTVSARIEDGILYMRISNFNQGTAKSVADEITKAKAELKGGLKGTILDLRGNPGGLLKQSVKVADLLLTHGHILTTKGRHPDSLHYYEAGGRDMVDGLPVVVIIDGKSASASEIVAAALQDRDRAVVLGTSSYGKGSVQTVIRLPNDGEITLTWSRFVAPSGYALHGLGVLPSICTSEVKAAVKPAIDKALADRLKIRTIFDSWRTPGSLEKVQRERLRKTCPSERRKGYTDIRIAKYLARNLALYSQALDISATTAQARK